MSRKDPAWKYGTEVDTPASMSYKYIQCNFCDKVIKGGVYRMKLHLAGMQGNCVPCELVTDEAKDEIKKYMAGLTKAKTHAKLCREEEIGGDAALYKSSSGSVTHSPRGLRGPMDRYVIDLDQNVQPPSENVEPRHSQGNAKEARTQVCMDIGRFFYENGIAFNVASSPSFVNMCRSIGNYGRGLKPPTAHELSTSILQEEEKKTQQIVDEVKRTWSQTGVSIMSDGWKDIRGRQLLNFLVNNPNGTVFLKSVDASAEVKDSNLLFKLLDEVVEEVGEDIVVQVITDNAANYKAAGAKLMEKRPGLWWTPCAAHCIDLILEKIGDLPQHKNALRKAKKVTTFIYNHGWVLAMMRTFTKKDLVRPAPTRFATAYLTLQSLYSLKQPLEQMFTSKEWETCSWAKKNDGKEIKKIILRDSAFWSSVSYALKTTKPLVRVLRMTDSEKMPGMGFIYGAMDKAKEEIAHNLNDEEGAYKEIWSIIDQKWEYQLHRHLHAAAYYLNPRYQYADDFSTHPEVKMGLMTCMWKLVPEDNERIKIDLQLDNFTKRMGLFGFGQAKSTIFNRSPADWWLQYGDQTPELRKFAVRILSLTCSSSGCERNWSAFNMIHTKKRNRLSTKRLNSLVYIMYNRRLKHKFLRQQALTEDEDPLVSEDLPSDGEWMVEERVNDDISPPSGSRQIRRKRKRGSNLDKGKRPMVVDEEEESEETESDDVDLELPSDDDNNGGGNNTFDPHFQLLDTYDTTLDI